MAKLEKEIKILDIDVEKTQKILLSKHFTFKGTKEQHIFTYDLLDINIRYKDAMKSLKSKNEICQQVAKRKLEVVLDEFCDLEDDNVLMMIEREMSIKFKELFNLKPIDIYKKINNSKLLLKEINKFKTNPNKWIRLRQSNDVIELTVKHVYNKNREKIQKVKEFEINVSDLDEANQILEEIGVVRRNYQEKIRHSYLYKNAQIEIDLWPKLEPYMEIECDDEKTIQEIIDLLEFSNKRIVSLNTEQLYKEKGIDVLKITDLKF